MRAALAALACLAICPPTFAVTGNAPPAGGWAARAMVMIVDARGDLCTGTALARDLVLTAAHCVAAAGALRVKAFQNGEDDPGARDRAPSALRHRELSRRTAPPPTSRCSSSPRRCPASWCRRRWRPRAASPRRNIDHRRLRHHRGRHRARARRPAHGELAVTGKPGSLQIRLYDAATRNARAGLGACTGDSGAPAYDGERPAGDRRGELDHSRQRRGRLRRPDRRHAVVALSVSGSSRRRANSIRRWRRRILVFHSADRLVPSARGRIGAP